MRFDEGASDVVGIPGLAGDRAMTWRVPPPILLADFLAAVMRLEAEGAFMAESGAWPLCKAALEAAFFIPGLPACWVRCGRYQVFEVSSQV